MTLCVRFVKTEGILTSPQTNTEFTSAGYIPIFPIQKMDLWIMETQLCKQFLINIEVGLKILHPNIPYMISSTL